MTKMFPLGGASGGGGGGGVSDHGDLTGLGDDDHLQYHTDARGDVRYLRISNNLSDLNNVTTARTNLGLGTIATQAANNVNITGGSITGITDLLIADGGTGASNATDARTNLGLGTIATQAANNVNITGGSVAAVAVAVTVDSDANTTRTLQASDHGRTIRFTSNSAITVNVPALFTGFTCEIIQAGTGQVTMSASGVTLNNRFNHTKTAGQHSSVRLLQTTSTLYNLAGDTAL